MSKLVAVVGDNATQLCKQHIVGYDQDGNPIWRCIGECAVAFGSASQHWVTINTHLVLRVGDSQAMCHCGPATILQNSTHVTIDGIRIAIDTNAMVGDHEQLPLSAITQPFVTWG